MVSLVTAPDARMVGARSNTMTKQYDREAMKYLSWALYPLIACYAVYALLYETHRSWYSWILNSLVGAVYTFGFILMCPQVPQADFHICRARSGVCRT